MERDALMSGKLPGPLSDDPLQDTRKFPLTRSAIKQEEVRSRNRGHASLKMQRAT